MMDMTYIEIAKAFACAGGAVFIALSFFVSVFIPLDVNLRLLSTQRSIMFAIQGIALFMLGVN